MIVRGIANEYNVTVYLCDDIDAEYYQVNEYGTECLDMYSLMSENRILIEKDYALDRYSLTQQEVEDLFESVRDKLCPIIGSDKDGFVVEMR